MNTRWSLALLALAVAPPVRAQEKELRWGTDPNGGAPYISRPDPNGPYVGFEVELAEYLAKKLGRVSRPQAGEWNTLPNLLDQPRDTATGIDIVLNGYELRDDLVPPKGKFAATDAYYVYRLQLVARKDDDEIKDWSDLAARRQKRIGVLQDSVAFKFAEERFKGHKIEALKDVAPMFGEVADKGLVDVTIQDNPACVYFVNDPKYRDRLKLVGEGRQPGEYVIYLRQNDKELRDAINAALRDGFKDGTIQRIYRKYGLWSADQEGLARRLTGEYPPEEEGVERVGYGGSGSVWPLLPQLLRAAGMTVFLSITSFPLAMLAGVVIAISRVYAPAWVKVPFAVFVEVIRGTPLLLQLYFLFFILPKWAPALAFDPVVIGIFGLAMNYAAYEAENYRAGILSIPRGQMEAALALGMTPFTAIMKVIVPQAVRVVIPPVTNDFIALFKDTSVCSVILIVELTRKYNELYNFNRDLVVELAFLTAALYLLMSYPMSLLARVMERRMGTHTGGTNR